MSPPSWVAGVRGEAVALQLVEDLGVPAPRLLGVDVSGEFGSLLLLETVVPGTSTVSSGSPLERMRALGAAAARLHTLSMPPGHSLMRISKPVWPDDYVGARSQARAATTPLLEVADNVYTSMIRPARQDVLVHGDFHHQNVHWMNDRVVAYIDWDSTGLGHPGIDIGWSRLEATLAYSPAAANAITQGWTTVTGQEPVSLAYCDKSVSAGADSDRRFERGCWGRPPQNDLVAALQTHADIGSRTEKRDAFLRAALARLEHD